MDFTTFALVFTSLWKLSVSVRCYKCSAEMGEGVQLAPCDNFDPYDPKFYIDCEYSTICFKRETHLMGLGKTATFTERSCAPQLIPGEQKKINGTWRHVKHIYEEYQETCTEDSNDSQRATKTINCYCRGDYCNSSTKIYVHLRSILGFVLFAIFII